MIRYLMIIVNMELMNMWREQMGWGSDGISGSPSTSLCAFASGAAIQATGGAVPNLVTWRWQPSTAFRHVPPHSNPLKLTSSIIKSLNNYLLYVSIHPFVYTFGYLQVSSSYPAVNPSIVRLWCVEWKRSRSFRKVYTLATALWSRWAGC
jgi:hypothetical protein